MADAIGAAKGITAKSIDAILRCATAVAATGSAMDACETELLLNLLTRLGGDRGTYKARIFEVVKQQASMTNVGIFSAAYHDLEWAAIDACFVISAAVAARSNGIDARDGLAIQKLGTALGIGVLNTRYNTLLGQGMQLAR